LGQPGQQAGAEGHVVVEEEHDVASGGLHEQVAGRPRQGPAHVADPGVGEAGVDRGPHLVVAVGADEDLEAGPALLLLEAGQAGVEQRDAPARDDADAHQWSPAVRHRRLARLSAVPVPARTGMGPHGTRERPAATCPAARLYAWPTPWAAQGERAARRRA